MKSVLFFIVMAFAVASVFACDPDGNNKPECTSSNLNVNIRNFWDPTRYWLCEKAGAAPTEVRCKGATPAFDSATGKCVSWDSWKWTPPCPSVRP